ncbi:DNA-deoxyinosine glycosylase [Sphingobacterium sp. LRF_L2]|uniref:DNA-deoxyinosine glycosylase n=1 Tax=Sphingobacterium sp. LRF_L2 TaxID=3369421 RepID=UPI003F602D61
MYKNSFAPVIPLNSKILILGSLPGDRSIIENQYYAHPRNRFWNTLAALFEEPIPTDYKNKIDLLQRRKIAVWDVCAKAHRIGSMDTAIVEEIPNQINQLLLKEDHINAVCFNGQTAEKLYDKYFIRLPHLTYISLPSTSPANATFDQNRLIEKWKIILTVLY